MPTGRIWFLMVAALVSGCGIPSARRTLEISYEIGEAALLQPSYQTAIWLEDEKNRYVKSFFVSQYLSYCGSGYTTICPDWIGVANWDSVSEAELDAVTGATPRPGTQRLVVDCRERGIPPGSYQYCVQTHITEGNNILYRGKIDIGKTESRNVAEVTYSPGVPAGARGVLGKVEALYRPE